MRGSGAAQPGSSESMPESVSESLSESFRCVAPRLAVGAVQTRPRVADGGGEAIEGGGGGACRSRASLNGEPERGCSFFSLSHTHLAHSFSFSLALPVPLPP